MNVAIIGGSTQSRAVAVTGTEFNYYLLCKRKLWLFSHDVEMEHTSDNVLLGKLIDEESYPREKKGIVIDNGSIEILPIGQYDNFCRRKKEKRYLEAKRLLVPIQIRQSKRLFKEKILWFNKELDEYIANLEYSSDTGLDISKQIENIY